MYGTVSEEGRVEVDFIYEPPQQGLEDDLILLRDPEEEKLVDAIAAGLGRKRVGFIFTQTIMQDKKDYNFSNKEVLQAAELHAESGLKEWVTVVVKLEANEDGAADVHFEAFQMSDMCVKLFKEGWFVTEFGEDDDPKLSKIKKEVVVGGKDVKEVDNDFFLVVVKIFDHQVRNFDFFFINQFLLWKWLPFFFIANNCSCVHFLLFILLNLLTLLGICSKVCIFHVLV